ncbi:hypothetical protein SAMN05443663_10516 [Flavobacterium defluvii]|uniref:Uncharacterized protein n=1 Tax=Flavobacterium defluvii TaxID=370979 RepID=A0A1M5PHL1_9FLAO|nr:hypothetical protein SAMN05443663_10516 [Flavobacterium defluvii]
MINLGLLINLYSFFVMFCVILLFGFLNVNTPLLVIFLLFILFGKIQEKIGKVQF